MLRAHAKLFRSLLLVFDVFASAAVFVLVVSLPSMWSAVEPQDARVMAILVPGLVVSLAWPLILDQFDLYSSQRRANVLEMLGRFVTAGCIATLLIEIAVTLVQAPLRPWFAMVAGAGQFVALTSVHLCGEISLRVLRRSGRNYRNVLIIGSGARARDVLGSVERHGEWGLRVVGFLDDQEIPYDDRIPGDKIHKLHDLPMILRNQVIDEVIVACPRSMLGSIGPAVAVCATAGVPVTLLSDLFGDYLPPPQVTRFGTLAALSFAPVHHSGARLTVKRLIDIVGSAALLVVCSPLLALAAIAIKATSEGPVFFRQIRCGKHGHHFHMFKLRTMHVDAESRKAELMALNEMDGPVFKIRYDPRITPVGRILRRWSVDEIPQFFNVFKGDMSLVGPRPPVPIEVAEYATFDRRRLSMRPGITCLWQVSGRNAIGFEEWVKLDLEYIDNWSLLNDLKILARTVPAALRGTGS
ncbi:MAG: sugar transferase [Myxococcales bacterium]|nr:sugar transferase [Myxococcales bacterium]MDH5307431.1 sugar transferase [Myxococcales bacterium]MDH5567704.1 sugar transferase [Myxococcales bacterium]